MCRSEKNSGLFICFERRFKDEKKRVLFKNTFFFLLYFITANNISFSNKKMTLKSMT